MNMKTKMNKSDILLYKLDNNITAFTTTRNGGGCNVDNYSSMNINPFCGDKPENIEINKKILCNLLNINTNSLIIPHQIHGTDIAVIDSSFHSSCYQFEADALITNKPDICIGISTADCVPILIYDKTHKTSAAIHAGWRGTLQRIAELTIDKMHNCFGTESSDCQAIIGPCIGLNAFEVGNEVYDSFIQAGFDMTNISIMKKKHHIDLTECNRLQLTSKGIKNENIFCSNICTYTEHEKYFSARRLGINSGRLFTGIIIRKNTSF